MKTKRYPIALFMPSVVALLIAFGRHIVQCMTNNSWFPSPSPDLNTVSGHLDALETAQTQAKTRTVGAAAARDLKKKEVEDDLTALKAYVHSIVLKNTSAAVAIILSAGMSPKTFGIRTKLPLEALMGSVPGQVLLRAKAAGKRVAYEWQYSADSGKTWQAIGITTDADTSIDGLTEGAMYMFRVRSTIKKETGAWTQPISFLVH